MTEYRPRVPQDPTLASGSEALPAEVSSDGGFTGCITPSRMAGNGEFLRVPYDTFGCEEQYEPEVTFTVDDVRRIGRMIALAFGVCGFALGYGAHVLEMVVRG